MAVSLNGLNTADPASAGGLTTGAAPGSGAAAAGVAAHAAMALDSGVQPDVTLSSLAGRMAQLEGSLTTGSAVSQERVNAAGAALASGNYSIDPDRVAAGVIQSEQLLRQLGEG